jgi:hypothetical protein
MGDLQKADPVRFFTAAIPVLSRLGGQEHAGGDYLVSLLLAAGFLPNALADTELFKLEEAIAIARAACRVDPKVAAQLAQQVGGANGDGGIADSRLMEILDAACPVRAVLPAIIRLIQHPSAHVRSKATLLIGKRSRNSQWVGNQLAQEDARIRANAVESLWGVDSPEARAVLWEAVNDPHARVAGNALLGLYKLGEQASIPLILRLFNQESDASRATAAWVMGATEDPRFMASLCPAALSGQGRIRPNAIRALERIKKRIARAADLPRLFLYLSHFRILDHETRQVQLSVVNQEGLPLPDVPATRLVISEDLQMPFEYRVERLPGSRTLTTAFGMPRSTGANAWRDAVQSALAECLARKRKSDPWTIVKFSPGAGFELELEPVRPIADRDPLESEIACPGPRALAASGELDCLRLMLLSLLPVEGTRRLILFADADSGEQALPTEADRAQMEQVREQARAAGIVVHALLPPEAPKRVVAVLQQICPATGGLLLRAASPEQVPGLLARLYYGDLDRRRLAWRRPEAAPERGGVAGSSPPAIRVQFFGDQGYGEDRLPPAGSLLEGAG